MQSDSLCIKTLMYDANTQNTKIAEKKDIILIIFSSISLPPKKLCTALLLTSSLHSESYSVARRPLLLTEATAEILTICHADVLPHAGWIPTSVFLSLVVGASLKSLQLF